MIFETHAHYDDEKFDGDREEILLSLADNGIGTVVNVGSSLASSQQSLDLAKKYSFVYAAVGVHPSDVGDLDEDGIEWLRQVTKEEKVVAIGEIGLDYYWDKEEEVHLLQKKWFIRQLELAAEVGLPVIIHSRDAAEDTMQILKDFCKGHPEIEKPGVVHCYSYSKEMALEYVKMGFYIGVGGVITFKNSRRLVETVEAIDLEHIVVETDSPYLAPEPHRGHRNCSLYLHEVVAKIAEIKGVTVEDVIDTTEENAKILYRFQK